jgi:hypothetical protein
MTTTIVKPIYGHTSFETAYCAEDYPYGRNLRTKMYFWLETKPKHGVRLVTRSLNPQNGRMNKQHNGGYVKIAANLYLDEKGHCQMAAVSEYTNEKEILDFIKNFPDCQHMADIKVWCLMKYKYLRTCVERKSSMFTINGVEQFLSEPELEKYTNEMRGWWKAYLLAAGKPEDTAEPVLKKKE